jgi:hypothetical protein
MVYIEVSHCRFKRIPEIDFTGPPEVLINLSFDLTELDFTDAVVVEIVLENDLFANKKAALQPARFDCVATVRSGCIRISPS